MPRRLGRLRQRKDFLRLAATRRKWVAEGLILQVGPSNAPERAGGFAEGRRVGFTASKKVGDAVQRNRAKRRLRAAAAAVLAQHGLPETDFVLIARPATPVVRFDQLTGAIRAGLKRFKLWREDGEAAMIPADGPGG